ncbi:right-handed parallel beta-helix repeat-containing protein [Marinicella sp. S1101]|uniref:right-handed parallel beta-helix repeat-containing protein n=1 Tax=Marinicella marina TaxID=2996016 RepID=UPI002260C506|nr:right-handed parallel beta-helix repeat-containing protein [Marinicella marina]MCX7554388.1 right-handed parallel beta-helix repeat-containing protein [Marinicella marina]MDJ1138621.1 NosD domain-containing protein [Marinicella marina]
MQKTLKIWLFSVIMGGSLSFNAASQEYCENGSYGNQLMWVESVASDPFNNQTGPFNNQYGDQDHLYIGYADYSNLNLNWQVGLNQLTLNPGRLEHPIMVDYPTHWQVWIDLNSDYDFTADERVWAASGFASEAATVDLSGLDIEGEVTTRLRISASFYENSPVCGSIGHGEVEDYSVTITPPIKTTWLVPEEYDRIQDAVNAATTGGTVLVNDGIYDEYVIIRKALSLVSVNGRDRTQITGNIFRPNIWVQSPNVTISGFSLDGRSNQFDAGILFDTGSHDGQVVDLACGLSTDNSDQHNNIHIKNSDRIVVSGLDCQFRGGHGIFAENTEGSRFIDNTFYLMEWAAIEVRAGKDIEIRGNQSTSNNYTGLIIRDSESVAVADNSFSFNPRALQANGLGGIITGTSDISVINNSFSGNSGNGLTVGQSVGVQLINNRFIVNKNYGLSLVGVDDVVVKENLFEYNQQAGLLMSGVNAAHITENEFSENYGFGIELRRVNDSLFEQNSLNNNYAMISLERSSDNAIRLNQMSYSTPFALNCQIDISQSYSNELYLNDFIFTADDGFCINDGSYNDWQSLLPLTYQFGGYEYTQSLGNYYNQANLIDQNGDGVGDGIYRLPGQNQYDNQPLMEPISSYIQQ